MSKPIVTVLTGLPASGKSTYAKSLNMLRVNLDDIRKMMGWTSQASWSKEKEAVAIETMMSAIEGAVEGGHSIVVDNTHLTARLPGIMRRRVGGRATFKVVSFLDVSVEECIKRDAARENSVGESAIRKMAKTSGKWKLSDEYMNVWPDVEEFHYVGGLPECIIVDLDGTLAIHTTRGPYETERCDEDIMDSAVEAVLFGYALTMFQGFNARYKVIFMSGREGTESVRAKTEKWLRDNMDLIDDYPDSGIDYELHMREEGDGRPDFVTKYELFNEHIRGKYNVLFALDDRDQVVRLWREMDIKCLQVGYGNF